MCRFKSQRDGGMACGKSANQAGGQVPGIVDVLDAALVEESTFGPALSAAGDFAVADHDVVLHGVLETLG